MNLSNIRIEHENGIVKLVVDVSCKFSTAKQLWFSVDKNYMEWLTDDVFDAFMVAVVWPCMCYGEDIEIDGGVSKKLYKNLTAYILPLIKSIRPQYKMINILPKSYINATKGNNGIVGTGFSGGVDSFSTLIDKFENESDIEYKINTLFFFHLGQYGNINDPNTKSKAIEHYEVSNSYAIEANLPFVFMDSNMFEFYKPEWEYDAGPLCRIAAILVFQRALIRYYVSGSYHYMQLCDFQKFYHLDDVADPFIYIMLSPDNLEIILDGSQYYRSEKTVKVASYAPAHHHLNVCVNSEINIIEEKNCSVCHKCNRTLIILEALGKLHEFNHVFDIKKYKKQSYQSKCWSILQYNSNPFSKDGVDFTKSQGIKYPSYIVAWFSVLPNRVLSKLKGLFK